jgi:ubiquinone/menaquinone biosynthesis C-methylase UbiE
MRLGDKTQGLKKTDLEAIRLTGDRLQDYAEFWERSARTDAITAIADHIDEAAFEQSGRVDAGGLLALVPEDAVVLEIGCGIGRVLQHLSEGCREVHGVDISTEMVARGAERLAHLGNVHLHTGNGYDLGLFEDGRFDLVFSSFVFQHMPKTIAFNYMTETARVLKPGGRFRLQVPNLLREEHLAAFRHFAQPYFVENPYPMNFYSPPELVRMLEAAGFGVTELDDYMVALARKGVATSAGVIASGLSDLERAHLGARIAQLEAEVARMRRVYDQPLVRALLKARRRLRRRSDP